jgi:hypothetical protein
MIRPATCLIGFSLELEKVRRNKHILNIKIHERKDFPYVYELLVAAIALSIYEVWIYKVFL